MSIEHDGGHGFRRRESERDGSLTDKASGAPAFGQLLTCWRATLITWHAFGRRNKTSGPMMEVLHRRTIQDGLRTIKIKQ